MRPLRYSINVTLDGCCDHRAIPTDEELHRHFAEKLGQADALLFGRVIYEMVALRASVGSTTRATPVVIKAGEPGADITWSGNVCGAVAG
jgi:hypothetical protein